MNKHKHTHTAALNQTSTDFTYSLILVWMVQTRVTRLI